MNCIFCEKFADNTYYGTCQACCEAGKTTPIGRTEKATYKSIMGVPFKGTTPPNLVWSGSTVNPDKKFADLEIDYFE
tara:strand:+ start:463 stop:693 length:231 start_codon:yes stop_codon:yes gene_type:complete